MVYCTLYRSPLRSSITNANVNYPTLPLIKIIKPIGTDFIASEWETHESGIIMNVTLKTISPLPRDLLPH